MDISAILAVIARGIEVAEALVQAGRDVAPALVAIKNLASNSNPTQADLDSTEAVLDGLMAEFNSDLPPAKDS
jgi:hypothetical protein